MGIFGNSRQVYKKQKVDTDEEEEVEEDDTEEEEEEEEDCSSYSYTSTCDNCGYEIDWEIDFGKTSKEHLQGKKCEECGCFIINPDKK